MPQRRAIRPLCPVCLEKPVSSYRTKTCGLSCGQKQRTDRAAVLGTLAAARDAQHEKRLAGIRKWIAEEAAALGPAPTLETLKRFGIRVWRRAYQNGVTMQRNRQKARERSVPRETQHLDAWRQAGT